MDDAPSQPPPPSPPASRPPDRARTPALREFLRKNRRTQLSDLIVPLVALGLACTLFYLLSQRQLVANILAVNDSDKPLTVQVNLERMKVAPGRSDRLRVYHVSGESMDVLAGGGIVESVRLPDVTPAWVFYNIQGKASLLVVQCNWSYGADGKRNTSGGPQFKVLANLKQEKIFTFGDAVVLGPEEPLPEIYTDVRPLLKVIRVPVLDLKTPDAYLRENLE